MSSKQQSDNEQRHAGRLTEPVEIQPGEFKPLGDCTDAEVEDAIWLLKGSAARQRHEATRIANKALWLSATAKMVRLRRNRIAADDGREAR